MLSPFPASISIRPTHLPPPGLRTSLRPLACTMSTGTPAGAASSSEPLASEWVRPPDLYALNTFGWSWHGDRTVDENFMDLVYMIARNSSCKDGHMGCVLVRGVPLGRGGERGHFGGFESDEPAAAVAAAEDALLHPTVVMKSINAPLYGAFRSDLHAEALAVYECAKRGLATAGLSCYVTRAPCVNCYQTLAISGVSRMVSSQPSLPSKECTASAAVLGVEYVMQPDSPERSAERDKLGAENTDYQLVKAQRAERKRLKQAGQFGRKTLAAHADAAAGEGEPG